MKTAKSGNRCGSPALDNGTIVALSFAKTLQLFHIPLSANYTDYFGVQRPNDFILSRLVKGHYAS